MRAKRTKSGWLACGWGVGGHPEEYKSTAGNWADWRGGKKVKNWDGGRRRYDQPGKAGTIPVTGMAGFCCCSSGLGEVGCHLAPFPEIRGYRDGKTKRIPRIERPDWSSTPALRSTITARERMRTVPYHTVQSGTVLPPGSAGQAPNR